MNSIARNQGAVAVLCLGLMTAGFGNPANRIYIKNNGNVAAALDPQGQWFTRSFDEDNTSSFAGSLTFKHSGTVFCTIRNESASDPRQFGKMMINSATDFF